jgi:hypothetical protein
VVRELSGGHSTLAFDYRIVAKRKGYEQIRLADKTAMMAAVNAAAVSQRANTSGERSVASVAPSRQSATVVASKPQAPKPQTPKP